MISVCIATYNGDQFIEKQLNSILIQLGENDEIIICDDFSTDKTVEIVRSFNDKRIKILVNDKTLGVVRNFERAISLSKGNYIFLCDQDDIWESDKLQVYLSEFSAYDLLLSDASIIDEGDYVIKDSLFNNRNPLKGLVANLYKSPYTGCCMAFKADMKKYVLPFPPKIVMHDLWIGNICRKYGKVFFINKKTLKYRRHLSNLTYTSEKSKNSLFFKISCRLRLLYELMRR